MTKTIYEQMRIPVTWLGSVFFLALIFLTETRWEWSPLVEESLMLCACFFAGVGAFGRVWCALYIAGRKDQKLIREGPYALCRNPLYFFSLLGAVGVGLACESFTVPILIAAGFALYYPSIILREEKRLREIFGVEYDDYRRKTPSFFPKWANGKTGEPAEWTVNPRVFRRAITDAVWFIWLIGLIEFASACHEVGWLPILLRLY